MYPIVIALGYDGVWFGVVSIMMLLSGLLTPPGHRHRRSRPGHVPAGPHALFRPTVEQRPIERVIIKGS
jgi:hypothetical protein